MNRTVHYIMTRATLLVSLAGLGMPMTATAGQNGVSYSADHWPSRWGSAIRQKQNGHYPTRQLHQTPPPELPQSNESEALTGQNLFYSPDLYGQAKGKQQHRYRAQQQFPRFRRYRDNHRAAREERESRKAAYAYHGMPALQYGHYTNPYQFPLGTAPMGIDPVLGHPGIGIPILPGVPYGYPGLGLPFTGYYPGAYGMGNPVFGGW